jgi:hypothetical protein
VPEIHQALCDRGASIAERTVTHLLQHYAAHINSRLRSDEEAKAIPNIMQGSSMLGCVVMRKQKAIPNSIWHIYGRLNVLLL